MRIIGLFATGILLAACTTPPIFPSEVMKDVETGTFDFKAWQEQTNHPSDTPALSRTVELGGHILSTIRKPDSVVIIAEEQPIEKYPGYCRTCVKRNRSSTFAIVFAGSLEPSMLQAGNELAVVGTTDKPSPELIAGTPKLLPHLNARCLHIWKTQEAQIPDFVWEGAMGYVPPGHGIFCRENGDGKPLSTGSRQGDEEKDATGS